MNPSVQAALNAVVPYPIIGATLWDHLRDVSLSVFNEFGQWSVSSNEPALRHDVLNFARLMFADEHDILWGDPNRDDPIQVRGPRLNHRFNAVEGCEEGTSFIIARNPFPGEIVTVHSNVGPMAMLHTNVFVAMFQHERLRA